MKYGTVCSGIEAPSVAWEPLGWEPQWFSEIEPFPKAALAHHYPDVPDLGDMTKVDWKNAADIELLIGGTPCQSFSVAGLRKGLDDPRGNLALEFLRIVDIKRPRWFIWENVPGVLSSNSGRDFGAFLGAVGKLGYGFCYRILDAQNFGVPQRRRRVFVVGHSGDWRCPAAVLLERESLLGDSAKGRKARAGVAALTACGVGTCGADDNQAQARHLIARESGPGFGSEDNSAGSLRANPGVSNVVTASGQANAEIAIQSSPATLNCNRDGAPILFEHHMQDSRIKQVDVCPSINAKAGTGGGNLPIVFTQNDASRDAGTIAPPNETNGPMGVACSRQGPTGAVDIVEVRRLTPVECERLQGFPDNYTRIPWNGKQPEDCPTGHRYKALGNSMAAPVVRWLGERIEMVEGGDYDGRTDGTD